MMISREHLELLSQNFKNIDETTKEIINLEAILTLPKGTEHFLSDIHGEYEAFDHILSQYFISFLHINIHCLLLLTLF